ncbi:hypothetical protein ACG2OD_01400 [Streptomyces sp. PDY-4]|uniref:hypothetical protein n=1 Tax=Streptomyces sp. PDY-4 TaxID=3376070 RepID=UPI0037A05E3D
MPAVVAVAYFAWQAAGSVRAEQRTIADKARELDAAASLPGNEAQLPAQRTTSAPPSCRPTAPSAPVSCPGKQRRRLPGKSSANRRPRT